MTTQSDALRLAESAHLGYRIGWQRQAAAELRRLARVEAQRDALRAELKEATEAINDPAVNNLRTLPESIRVLCAQRDALLEALIRCRDRFFPADQPERDRDELWEPVNAAIKAVEEGK